MSEDPTRDIEQKYDTKPTLETVLLRLEEFRSEVNAFRSEVNTRLDGLQAEIAGAREETRASLRKFGHKIDALNNDILELRADMRDLVSRTNDSEVKQ